MNRITVFLTIACGLIGVGLIAIGSPSGLSHF